MPLNFALILYRPRLCCERLREPTGVQFTGPAREETVGAETDAARESSGADRELCARLQFRKSGPWEGRCEIDDDRRASGGGNSFGLDRLLFNELPGFGFQVFWRPEESFQFVSNGYAGWDTQDSPGRLRFHSDTSVEYRCYNAPGALFHRAAFSVTADFSAGRSAAA